MSPMRDYEAVADVSTGQRRLAAGVDLLAAVLIAVLAFPFPIVRASVTTPVFVGLVAGAVVVVHACYLAASAVWLGRTLGMYLFDLGFAEGPPSAGAAARWALVSAVLPGGHPLAGVAARVSGLTIGGTRPSG